MGIGAIGSRAWNLFQRGASIAPDFVLGTGNEIFSKTLTNSFYGAVDKTTKKRAGGKYFKNFWTQLKDATKKAEKHNIQQQNLHGGFWKNMLHQTKTLPGKVSTGWKVGAKSAAKAGKIKWWGGLKGSVGALGKRLPLLGGLLMIATEIPNIFGAFKDDGIFGGLAEAGKSATRVTAGMIGGAIGAALLTPIPVVGPILGSIVGYMAGDGLASLITGKSHSEKKAEQEALTQQSTPQTQQASGQQHFDTGSTNPFAQSTMTPEQLQAMYLQLYGGSKGNDFMASTAGL